METKTTRKCSFCKEEIVLEHDDFVFDGKVHSHSNCFVKKRTEKSKKNISEEEAEELIKKLKVEHKPYIDEIILKNHFYMWLYSSYDLTFIPNYFFQKMAGVNDGTWTGLLKPIPYEHIFDMWKRHKKKLDKINNRKKRKGEAIEGANRLNYDLAVLLGKYDSYLRWKEKQEAASYIRKKEMKNRESGISYNKIIRTKPEKEDDIDEILNSI